MSDLTAIRGADSGAVLGVLVRCVSSLFHSLVMELVRPITTVLNMGQV